MGSKGSSGETLTSYQAPQTAVPNSPQVNDQAQGRLNAASPYMMSPYRAMDYLSGYTAPSSTVPTASGSTGALGSAMAPSTGLSGNNFTGSSGATAAAAQPQVAPASAYSTPMAGTGGLNWWNQAGTSAGQPQGGATPQTGGLTPQAAGGMAQNVQSSLAGLSQLLGKGTTNPAPQQAAPTTQQTATTPTTQGTGK